MPATAAKVRNMFIPCPLESVTLGKATVKLYPIITSSMQRPEHARAFQVNKIALAAPDINRRTMLDTLGAQLSLNATVNGALSNWDCHFNRNWCNFAHLSILSFHNNVGAQVVDTVTVADSAVLCPVQDGAADKCHWANIKFAHVQLNLDFSALVTLRPPGNTLLCAEYYIELPQDSRNMTVALNQAYHLTTYLGPGDLQAMAAIEFMCEILGITLQDKLVDILSPTFNLTLARMYRTTLVSKIRSKIIMLATPSILEFSLQSTLPRHSKEPHAALDHIWQMYEEAECNTIFQLVFDYYTQILGASYSFVDQDPLPISICQVFIDGLNSHLIAGFFCSHFPNYGISQALTATHQCKTLEAMMQAAVKAKTDYTNIRTIASEIMGGTPGQAA
jgi:hypothetical protein